MLGWAIKRGLENATGAPAQDTANTTNADDTQLEQPDTPAPVFAVRALRTALFGTPAPKDNAQNNARVRDDANVAVAVPAKADKGQLTGPPSPTKPAGILLTPGTATARRKRVSFNQNVHRNGQGADGKDDVKPLCTNPRPRTRLTDALEKSRKTGRKSGTTEPQPSEVDAFAAADDAWEEVDELDRDPDITVDLNEPHSRSGKYWKSEFQQYHADAKVEMEKLVKYKQLAKSYAKMKDAEALELNQKLQEERDRVVEMEARVTELAAKIATKRMKGTDKDNQDLIKDLTQQTALAVQYRSQVKELDALLKTRQADSADGYKARRQTASPRTHKTLLETQRELKKAREQLRELGELRREIRHLKSGLRTAEQRELKVETENKRVAQDLSKAKSKIESLETRLKVSEEAGRQYQQEAEDWKRKYETLKENAKARYGEAEQAICRKEAEISDLGREVERSKGIGAASTRAKPKSIGTDETIDNWTDQLDALAEKLAVQDGPADRAVRQRERDSHKHSLSRARRLPRDSRKLVTDHDFQIREDKDAANNEPDDESQLPVLRERNALQPVVLTSGETSADRSKKPPLPNGRATLSAVPIGDRKSASSAQSARDHLRKEAGYRDRLRTVLPVDNMRQESRKQRSVRSMAQGDRLDRQATSSDSDEPGYDLVRGKFARLGGPDTKASTDWAMNTSRSALPADRRAAAIARIEQKRSERRRQQGRQGRNKENVLT